MADLDSRRGPDVLTLIVGMLTLFAAGYVLSDGALWVPSLDLRWLLAGGAVLVGLLLLLASLRGGRKHKD